MPRVCDVCGKGPQFGHKISHAHNVTNRRWNVNIQTVRARAEWREQANSRVHIVYPQAAKFRKLPKFRKALNFRVKFEKRVERVVELALDFVLTSAFDYMHSD